jgi:hypothetical protein
MKKGDFEKYLVVLNESHTYPFDNAKSAYCKWYKAILNGDECRIYCNDVDLTDNVVAMGSKRGW